MDDALFEIRSSATSLNNYMPEAGFDAALAIHDEAVRAEQSARDTEKIEIAVRAKEYAEAESRLEKNRSDAAWKVIKTDYWRNNYDALASEKEELAAQLAAAQETIEKVKRWRIDHDPSRGDMVTLGKILE